MIDSRSVGDLHPAIGRAATELIKRMKAIGYNVLITSTYRDFAKQNALYALGRTAVGNIVTNARGGESIHNYRLAFDICKNVKGQEYSDSNFFKQAGKIGQELGLTWGGAWKGFVDMPHFEFTNGLSLSQLQKGARVAEDFKFKWEIITSVTEDKEVVEKTKMLMNGKETEVSRIFKDGKNYVEVQSLSKLGIDVDYDANKKMPVLQLPNPVEAGKVKIDGLVYDVDRILRDGSNFVRLRDLEQAGFFVTYDAENRMPVVYTTGELG